MNRRVANRYLLGKELGAGGTSRVHAALDEHLGRQVAIKLLDEKLVASADPAGRDRFLREGPTSASFNHRNAVTVYDAGEDDGDLYIVMELVDGQSLAEHMAITSPLPIEEAVDIATQVLAALAAAHAVGIVHRDVKPANVLLGSNGSVKLADFGIAKRFDDLNESVTTTGMMIGTPRYLAPEQATGAPVTSATDVYAMGILLFEMLTGQPPFTGDSLVAVATVQQSQPAPDVRSLRPEVSAGLAATVARALATKPADRFPTAAEMSAALAADDEATQPMATAVPASETQVMAALIVAEPIWAAEPIMVAGPITAETVGTRPSTFARNKSTTKLAMIAAGVVLLIVAVVALASGGDGDTTHFVAAATDATATATSIETASTLTEETASTLTESTAIASTVVESTLVEPTTTEPATTEAATTTQPATTTTTIATTTTLPPDIIPGFPYTDDIDVFLQQLEDDPELVGVKGPDLLVKLTDLLDQNPGRQRRQDADALRDEIALWVEDGDLHPAIAEALDVLLDELR